MQRRQLREPSLKRFFIFKNYGKTHWINTRIPDGAGGGWWRTLSWFLSDLTKRCSENCTLWFLCDGCSMVSALTKTEKAIQNKMWLLSPWCLKTDAKIVHIANTWSLTSSVSVQFLSRFLNSPKLKARLKRRFGWPSLIVTRFYYF